MTGVLMRREKRDRNIQGEDGHLMTEAETEAETEDYKLNTIKECQQTAEARREKEAFYPSSFRGNMAYADILVSDF